MKAAGPVLVGFITLAILPLLAASFAVSYAVRFTIEAAKAGWAEGAVK